VLKARICAGDADVGARFMDWAAATCIGPASTSASCAGFAREKRQIDRALRGGDGERRPTSSSGRGGIREIEFIVQALQLLYGGDDPWLRERNYPQGALRLRPSAGTWRPSSGGSARTRSSTCAPWSIACRSCTSSRPHAADGSDALGRSRAASASRRRRARPPAASRRHARRHAPTSTRVRRVLRRRRARRARAAAEPHGAQRHGFRRSGARAANLQLCVEGRRSCRIAALRPPALERLPGMLDALLEEPDPDEALNSSSAFCRGWPRARATWS
jgi:glutamine synthetase adenylyltransferase